MTQSSETFVLDSVVSFWDVDREQLFSLPGVFKLLQEGAIKHADMHGVGSRSMLERGETWVLNRISAALLRYPRYEERLRLVTWSAGIRGFKGYREFRLYAGEELILSGSSLWLYLNIHTKSFVRVPAELAAGFPERRDDLHHPDLDRLRLDEPVAEAPSCAVSLRYSDLDSNGHVNNTSYLDYLQTALAATGHSVRPTRVEMQFLKEIPPTIPAVGLRVESRDGRVLVAYGAGTECFAKAAVTV